MRNNPTHFKAYFLVSACLGKREIPIFKQRESSARPGDDSPTVYACGPLAARKYSLSASLIRRMTAREEIHHFTFALMSNEMLHSYCGARPNQTTTRTVLSNPCELIGQLYGQFWLELSG